MQAGKVPPELLARLVYPHLGRRPDVLRRAGIGQDCAALDFGEWAAVVTCDPITTAREHLGRLAVHVACNDLATSGAEPLALLITLLLREGATSEELEAIMREAGQAADGLDVEIVGGHTEVTPGIDRTIAVVTGIGRARKDALISPRAQASREPQFWPQTWPAGSSQFLVRRSRHAPERLWSGSASSRRGWWRPAAERQPCMT